MDFPLLRENSLSSYLMQVSNNPHILPCAGFGVEEFNTYSRGFTSFFLPGSNYSADNFQKLLLIYMHLTNNFLRKIHKNETTVFKCYCSKKTKQNFGYFQSPCKFSITVSKMSEDGYISIIAIDFVHNHMMLSKELYLTLVYKASMFHLKEIVQHRIESVVSERQAETGLEFNDNEVVNKPRPHPDKIENNSLYSKELRPQNILQAIKNSENPQSDEVKALLKELVGRKNSELTKKFENFVNKIKRQMLIVNL